MPILLRMISAFFYPCLFDSALRHFELVNRAFETLMTTSSDLFKSWCSEFCCGTLQALPLLISKRRPGSMENIEWTDGAHQVLSSLLDNISHASEALPSTTAYWEWSYFNQILVEVHVELHGPPSVVQTLEFHLVLLHYFEIIALVNDTLVTRAFKNTLPVCVHNLWSSSTQMNPIL